MAVMGAAGNPLSERGNKETVYNSLLLTHMVC